MTRILLAALAVLALTGLAEAHSTSSCLNSAACKAAIEAAVAQARAQWIAAQPCERFVRTAAEALPFVQAGVTVCVIVERVEPCGEQMEGEQKVQLYCTPKVQP